MLLLFKSLRFTGVVPGTVAVFLPLQIAGDSTPAAGAALAIALALLALGAAIHASCLWDFAWSYDE